MKCKKCSATIEPSAAYCPACGKKQKKMSMVTIVLCGAIIFLVIVSFMVFAVSRNKTNILAANPTSSALTGEPMEDSRPQLSDKETKILKWLIGNDLMSYAMHGTSRLKPLAQEPIFVSSMILQGEYDNNEVAADKRYRDKNLFVTGYIASIGRGIGEDYYLELKGGWNRFVGVRADMDDGLKDYLARLSKGEYVSLFCIGNGMHVGSAFLSKCTPIDVWVDQETTKYIRDFPEHIKTNDTQALVLASFVKALQPLLSPSSPCYDDNLPSGQQCRSELDMVIDSDEFFRNLEKTSKRYGTDLSGFIKEHRPQRNEQPAPPLPSGSLPENQG